MKPVIEHVADGMIAVLADDISSDPSEYSFTVSTPTPSINRPLDGLIIVQSDEASNDEAESPATKDQWIQFFELIIYSLHPAASTLGFDQRCNRMAADVIKAVQKSGDFGRDEVVMSLVESVVAFPPDQDGVEGRVVRVRVVYRNAASDPYTS